MTTKRILLTDIRIDGGTQPRERLCTDTVDEYEELIASGTDLPPPVVFSDGASFWLADGFHRYHALRQAGHERIECEVITGTQRDAILYAVGANHIHGLRRTGADKRHAVTMLLKDEEWSGRSDRWIAEKCGVGHPFVATVRTQLESDSSSHNGQAAKRRKGKDGKTRSSTKPKEPAKTPANDEKKAKERPKSKHGLPDDIEKAREEFQAIIVAIGTIEGRLEKLRDSDAGAFLVDNFAAIRVDLRNAQSGVKFSAPYKTCPYCKGRGCPPIAGEQTPCRGTGWTNRLVKGDGT